MTSEWDRDGLNLGGGSYPRRNFGHCAVIQAYDVRLGRYTTTAVCEVDCQRYQALDYEPGSDKVLTREGVIQRLADMVWEKGWCGLPPKPAEFEGRWEVAHLCK